MSILTSTKKILGVGEDDTSFDLDIITHINTEFSILTDLGIGPPGGFIIEDDEPVWADYIEGFTFDPEDPSHKVKLSKVKTAVYLRVRLLFDPPVTPHLLEAMKSQLQEHEWRLNVNREAYAWTDPDPSDDEEENLVSTGFGVSGFSQGGFGL